MVKLCQKYARRLISTKSASRLLEGLNLPISSANASHVTLVTLSNSIVVPTIRLKHEYLEEMLILLANLKYVILYGNEYLGKELKRMALRVVDKKYDDSIKVVLSMFTLQVREIAYSHLIRLAIHQGPLAPLMHHLLLVRLAISDKLKDYSEQSPEQARITKDLADTRKLRGVGLKLNSKTLILTCYDATFLYNIAGAEPFHYHTCLNPRCEHCPR